VVEEVLHEYTLLIRHRILPEILTGKKRMCLAITEPSAGSDVKNIHTTAEKTADGKHYIVNGEKKISYVDS
jgi:alkylation response protein AidB-like acyl-CoA dehydrogenase